MPCLVSKLLLPWAPHLKDFIQGSQCAGIRAFVAAAIQLKEAHFSYPYEVGVDDEEEGPFHSFPYRVCIDDEEGGPFCSTSSALYCYASVNDGIKYDAMFRGWHDDVAETEWLFMPLTEQLGSLLLVLSGIPVLQKLSIQTLDESKLQSTVRLPQLSELDVFVQPFPNNEVEFHLGWLQVQGYTEQDVENFLSDVQAIPRCVPLFGRAMKHLQSCGLKVRRSMSATARLRICNVAVTVR